MRISTVCRAASAAALLALAPAVAAGADLTAADGPALYRDLGPLAQPGALDQHYANLWERGGGALETLVIDPTQNQRHWQRLFDNRAPAAFAATGLSAWAAIARRVRIGAFVRYVPVLKATAAGPLFAVQILDGTTTSGAFFAGFAAAGMNMPRLRLLAPTLFAEWSGELLRTAGRSGRAPWLFLFGARLDQGYRFVDGRSGGAVDDTDVMDPWIRGSLRARYGRWQLSYSFGGVVGGRERLLLTHAATVSATLPR